jgi:hypothetical protein
MDIINNKLNNLKLFKLDTVILKDLLNRNDIRSLNFIAAYIISHPIEVISRIFIFNADTNIKLHLCNYINNCTLDIITTQDISYLTKINQVCLHYINRCISNDTNNRFNLTIQCSRRNLINEDKHFFYVVIVKTDIYSMYIIDSYINESKIVDFDISDDILITLLKQNIEIFSLNEVKIVTSTERNICYMSQAITNDLSCQVWSIMYQYIHLCTDIEKYDIELDKLLNINPFYWMMIFLSNIYKFYKYEYYNTDKRLDISIQQPNITYNWIYMNDYKYFDLRRQFLHLTQNCSDQLECDKYLKLLIENGQHNLVRLIYEKELDTSDALLKFRQILIKLDQIIHRFGNYDKYKNQVKIYKIQLQNRIDFTVNMMNDRMKQPSNVYTSSIISEYEKLISNNKEKFAIINFFH